MGRPTTYTPEVIDLAYSYVDDFASFGDAVPSVVGLCRVIERSRASVYNWAAQENNEFSDILQQINELQEHTCINRAIMGDYNAAIAKLLLGKHGYHDSQKVESSITLRDAAEMTDEELENIASSSSK